MAHLIKGKQQASQDMGGDVQRYVECKWQCQCMASSRLCLWVSLVLWRGMCRVSGRLRSGCG